MKTLTWAFTLTAVLTTAALVVWFDKPDTSILLTHGDTCFDDLIDRYHSGEFAAARQAVAPVMAVSDADHTRIYNQLVELRVENDQLHRQVQQQDARQVRITELMRIRSDLEQVKQQIDTHSLSPHAAIDQLLDHTESELSKLGVESELDKMLIKIANRELREHEKNRRQ